MKDPLGSPLLPLKEETGYGKSRKLAFRR